MKYFIVAAALATLAGPALAEDVGVRVGPVGAGVTVGQSPSYDRDRDRNPRAGAARQLDSHQEA
jgi:hypothetical protein